MRHILVAVLVVAMASVACAGLNPQVNAYITFDPAGDPLQNAVTPAPYTTVDAYLALGCVGGGVSTISFMLNDALVDCPGVMATQQFVNLMPGDLAIGNAFVAPGITIASTDCMTMDPVIVGYGSYFYLGGACCIQLLDHVDYPRWVVDCQEPTQLDYYCVQGHGSIGGAVCPDGEECPCDSPVEDATWGGIKALYR